MSVCNKYVFVCLRFNKIGEISIKKKYIFEKEKFIKEYDKLKSSRKMAKLYGCDKGTILKYAKSIGYKRKNYLTDEDKEEIVRQYETKTSSELAEFYGVTRGQITKVWYDNNLIGKERHSYPFNFNYFNTIDSSDKAYFLGLLASDGNVLKKEGDFRQAIISLTLKEYDKMILEVFKFYIQSEKPLHFELKKGERNSYVCKMELVSDKTANDLKKYNIVPQKTYKYEIVDLGKEYMSHFFRGYFDGDGSISCTKNMFHTPSSYNINIAGYVHNLEKMQEYLYKNAEIDSRIILDTREYKYNLPFGNLSFVNIENKYKFLEYIYKDKNNTYIHRKRYLAECFFNALQINHSSKHSNAHI